MSSGLDGDAADVLAALEALAARETIPVVLGPDTGISRDGQVLICWADLGEPGDHMPAGPTMLRFEAYVRLCGAEADARRGVDAAFWLPGWGQRRDGSRLTRLPSAADTATRARVATVIAERLAAHLDDGADWHHLLNRLRAADPTWA